MSKFLFLIVLIAILVAIFLMFMHPPAHGPAVREDLKQLGNDISAGVHEIYQSGRSEGATAGAKVKQAVESIKESIAGEREIDHPKLPNIEPAESSTRSSYQAQ